VWTELNRGHAGDPKDSWTAWVAGRKIPQELALEEEIHGEWLPCDVKRLGSNWGKLARGPWPETIIDEGSFDLSLSLSLSLSFSLSHRRVRTSSSRDDSLGQRKSWKSLVSGRKGHLHYESRDHAGDASGGSGSRAGGDGFVAKNATEAAGRRRRRGRERRLRSR
jgi:hypothetical protein